LSDDRAPLGALLRARAPQAVAGLLIGALALWLALWGVPLGEVASALAAANLSPLLLIGLLFVIQQAIRAWRQALIVQGAHPEHTFRDSLSVLCVSFLLINTLPARLGELSRPLLLLERDGTPLGAGFAAVVLERALDLMSAFIMLALVAWFVPATSHTLTLGGQEVDWVALGQRTASIVLPVIVGALLVLLFAGRPALRLIGRAASGGGLRERLLGPVLRFGEGFVDAIESTRSPARLAKILGLTVVTWAMTGLMYPLLARAFGVGDLIGYGEGIGVLCVTMLGMIVPSAPGFAGTYEAFFRAGLALFGVSGGSLDATAVAMALTLHWWIFGVQALTAIYFLVVDRISLSRLLGRLHDSLSAQSRSTSTA
jgi:uncharacterized protein (TIRG00374 family)